MGLASGLAGRLAWMEPSELRYFWLYAVRMYVDATQGGWSVRTQVNSNGPSTPWVSEWGRAARAHMCVLDGDERTRDISAELWFA